MNETAAPIGRHREQTLIACLQEVQESVQELQRELPNVNDEELRPTVSILVDAASIVLDTHGGNPKPTIADDLRSLMSAVKALKIPARDPDLGRTPTLDRIRKSKGLIIAGLIDALDAAAVIGLYPQQSEVYTEVGADMPRSGIEALLAGILQRLAEVEKSLGTLDEEKYSRPKFLQQTGLIDFYTDSMKAEINLAKLHFNISDKTIDFNALARAVETMAGLTRDFVSTALAWTGRIGQDILEIAKQLPTKIKRVASGIKATAKWHARQNWKRLASSEPTQQNSQPQEITPWSVPKEILAIEPNFNIREFVVNARSMYEIIVNAYASSNWTVLKVLLSEGVYDAFVLAIRERAERGEFPDTRFLSIDSIEIVAAQANSRSLLITVRFFSKLISVTRDRRGLTVDGNPDLPIDIIDEWTFQRPSGVPDASWILVGTGADSRGDRNSPQQTSSL